MTAINESRTTITLPLDQQQPLEPTSCWLGRCWAWIQLQIFDPIIQLFCSIFSFCFPPPIPLSINSNIRLTILNAPECLATASANLISKPLVNLGATCYLNALLQMIARLNGFNNLLITPLPLETAYLENKQLLKGHLAAIIHIMRSPDNATVSIQHLKTLFHLLQVCGWRHQPTVPQDPQELLMFLRRVLCEDESSHLQKALILSYGSTTKVSRIERVSEISMALPEKDSPEITSMTYAVQNYLAPEFIYGYRPGDDGEEQVAYKQSCFVGRPPDTLFVQENRFGATSNGRPFRISTPIPSGKSPVFDIKLPVYELSEGNISENAQEHLFKFTVAICHRGGQSIEGGHYTTITMQTKEDNTTVWTFYDDSKKPVQYAGDASGAIPPLIANKIQSQGYYLGYERVEEIL